MAWARLDDGFDDHPKVLALLEDENGAAAIGLWTLCLAWAHRNTRQRGKIPGEVPARLPRRYLGPGCADVAALLVKVGLWEQDDIGGWKIHAFDRYLPSSAMSRSRAENGRKGGLAKAADLVATSQDVVATSQDVVATSQDVVATSQDVVATSQEPLADPARIASGQQNLPASLTENGRKLASQDILASSQNVLATSYDSPTNQTSFVGKIVASSYDFLATSQEPLATLWQGGGCTTGTTVKTEVQGQDQDQSQGQSQNLCVPDGTTLRCEGTKKDGKQCTRHQMSRFCGQHDPDKPDRAAAPGFEDFWNAYPRRVAKDAARAAWHLKVARRGVPAEKIIAAARRYAADPSRKPDFTAHPATWLNQGRYDDDSTTTPVTHVGGINWMG